MAIDEKITKTAATFGRQTSYKDDLFAAFEQITPLPVYPACATCPASFWSFDVELVCFCKVGKNETWGRKAHPVIACGEREKQLSCGSG